MAAKTGLQLLLFVLVQLLRQKFSMPISPMAWSWPSSQPQGKLAIAARLHFLASYRLIFINNRLFTDPRTGRMGVLYLAVSHRLKNSE
jgi:hypothetical protein